MKWLTRKLIAAVFVSGVFSISVSARQSELFTVNEGLPQNYLLGLAQDSAGFIWVGTKDGLARYDGYHFRIYRHGKDSLHTPAANSITNLYTDHHGYLWIQYGGNAIDRYDPSTGIFRHISNEKNWDTIKSQLTSYELLLDRHDNLWLLTIDKGFYRYDLRSKNFYRFTKSTGILDDSARAIMQDHSGKIWMVTQRGFSVYNYTNNKTNNLPFRLSHRQTYSGRKHKLGVGELESGKIVVTSHDSTMLLYDPVNNTFQTISREVKKLVYDSGLGNTNLVIAHTGDRWFTCNGRIFRIRKGTDDLVEMNDPNNPPVPDASALLIDRSGTLWFGKNAAGLCRINLNALPFVSKKYNYPNFETDILVNEMKAKASELPAEFTDPGLAYIFRNSLDSKNGLIWIQNYLLSFNTAKIVSFDINSKKINTWPLSLSKNSEVGISSDPNGNLYFIRINDWQPVRISRSNEKLEEQLLTIPTLPGDSLYKSGKVAINPVIDGELMWVMASNMSIDFGAWQLAAINLKTKQVKWYAVRPDNAEPTSSLLMMINDPFNEKYLWIGTTGNGLIRFDKTSGESHAFTTDDGLPNNTIYAIVPDDQHHLWLSSNKGITRFNTATYAIRNFDIADGLINNEFNRWHCFKLPDGRIAFGGMTGYTIFNPADIKDDAFQPRVLLSNLMINNKPLPDSAALNAGSLNKLNKLVLPYDQNFLSFEFASDEYNRPQKISYRYRLTNFDNDWVYVQKERFANYTKLPPGKYTLEINAANISGIWSSNIKKLEIVITPPWWQTWWAYAAYILIALGLIISFFYYRVRRIRLRQEMILQQKQTEQLRTIDEMKSRFFSNITHEFRTPLSLIISPVEKLQSEVKDEKVLNTLSSVQRNANRLLQLINQLLDLSKLESGNMPLNFSRGRLDEFIHEMVNSFQPLADHQQIELHCDCIFSEEYLFEADKLKTILFNLLSNAVKFTPPRSGGKIAVTAREEDENRIRLVVKDTGIGIQPGKLPFIFDRFFQADDSRVRSYEGTGIGLALVKELAELMHGIVTAESQPGLGTSITLIFPVEKAGNSSAPLWQKEWVAITPFKKRVHTNGHEKANNDLPLLLLVEDNEELLSFLRESFERSFRVLTAANGMAALQVARDELPDLVVSDVMMPEMDGYALCSQLKTDVLTSHIAVILLTAKISYESRLNGLKLGADDYINKPFHFLELDTRIRNLLDHQQKQRENYRIQLQKNGLPVQSNEPENPFLKNIYAIIDEMIDDSQLGASKLAEKNAMSLRTLNRKLNTMIGMTACDLIRQYRLQKSITLLKSGRNVSETAYLVGFETPAYFSQCFKEQYGVSPKDYPL